MDSRLLRQLAWAGALAGFAAAGVIVARELGAYATALVCGLAVVLCGLALWAEVRRPMVEVHDFLGALRVGELVSLGAMSPGPLRDEMRSTMSAVQSRFDDAAMEEVRLRAIVEHIPDALVEIDGDRVEALNGAARRAFGSASSLEDLDTAEPGLGRALKTIRPGFPVLWRTIADARRWHMTAKWIRTPERRRTIVSIQDIDHALGRAEFDAWRDLIRVVNHEIINALTPISSLAETTRSIAEQLPDGEPHTETLRGVSGALVERARSLRAFIGSYREFSRLPPAEVETVHLDALLASLVAELNALAGPAVVFHSEVQPLVVELDSTLIQQAVLNLIVNARDALQATVEPASIVVSLRRSETSVGDREVIVEVADRGPGVSASAAEHLFVPFFTTKEGGTGVGLSLVRQVCLAHRGYVRWENRPDGGARFEIHLPDQSGA